MSDWLRIWTEFPASVKEGDHLSQVGHTLLGEPLDPIRFEAMVGAMAANLGLTGGERLLDLCCGNGVVTVRLAAQCHSAVGVDFSPFLLEQARAHHAAANVEYCEGDVLRLAQYGFAERFDRFNLHSSLQYFEHGQFDLLLEGVLGHASDRFVFLLCGVLDESRKSAHLDTPERIALNARLREAGEDRLGTWWDREFIVERCRAHGLACRIDDASPGRINPDFRFDAIISR